MTEPPEEFVVEKSERINMTFAATATRATPPEEKSSFLDESPKPYATRTEVEEAWRKHGVTRVVELEYPGDFNLTVTLGLEREIWQQLVAGIGYRETHAGITVVIDWC